ncbi:hypothetical protein Q5752_001127 [Cryptotrichosporon argae]
MSLLAGITAYTRYSSTPSLVASFAVGGAMAVASMRIRDGMEPDVEIAAAGSGVLAAATIRRAIITRGAPIPLTVAVLASAGTAYYAREWLERRQDARLDARV